MGKPVNKTLRIAAMSAGEEIGHVSGPIVTFRGNGDPLRSLVANIEPVQAGTGDPSPDNVRPISGWSAVNVWRTGKNLLDPSLLVDQAEWKQGVIQLSPNTTYVISSDMPSAGTLFYASSSGSYGESRHVYAGHPVVLTTRANGQITYQARISDGSSSFSDYKTQLELGSTATAYEPYSGNQYTIQLGDTYYGGTLDVTNGVLTVDRAMADLGPLAWWSHGSLANVYTGEGRPLPRWSTLSSGSVADAICSAYVLTTSASGGVDIIDFSIALGAGSSTNIYVHDSTASGIDDFKVKINGVQLCYELATAITIPLTATQISTLQGQNVLRADSGDVDVEYIATGGEGGKLALLLRNRKELLIALRKGLTPAEAGLLNSTPLLGGFVRPGLSTDDEKEEDELW